MPSSALWPTGETLDHAAVWVAAAAALIRALGIVALFSRMAVYRRRAVTTPSSFADLCTFPEPPLLGVVAWVLLSRNEWPAVVTPSMAATAAGAAALSLLGWALILWAWLSFPAASPGHYILPEHELVSRGPYAFIRHPLYAGAFLIWAGLALAFRSPATLAITALYVVPAYVLYMRAEERMLTAHFGEAYRTYRAATGMVFPRIASGRRSQSASSRG